MSSNHLDDSVDDVGRRKSKRARKPPVSYEEIMSAIAVEKYYEQQRIKSENKQEKIKEKVKEKEKETETNSRIKSRKKSLTKVKKKQRQEYNKERRKSSKKIKKDKNSVIVAKKYPGGIEDEPTQPQKKTENKNKNGKKVSKDSEDEGFEIDGEYDGFEEDYGSDDDDHNFERPQFKGGTGMNKNKSFDPREKRRIEREKKINILRTMNNFENSDSDEDIRTSSRVGPQYQANVPPLLSEKGKREHEIQRNLIQPIQLRIIEIEKDVYIKKEEQTNNNLNDRIYCEDDIDKSLFTNWNPKAEDSDEMDEENLKIRNIKKKPSKIRTFFSREYKNEDDKLTPVFPPLPKIMKNPERQRKTPSLYATFSPNSRRRRHLAPGAAERRKRKLSRRRFIYSPTFRPPAALLGIYPKTFLASELLKC